MDMIAETEKSEFSFIKRWERPRDYMGETPIDYYVVYGRTRDSRILVNSNFDAILESLGGESGIDTEDGYLELVRIQRSSHFACGWVDIILVHESAEDLLWQAEDLLSSISDYPILDEGDYLQRISESCQELWECISLGEKIEHCQRNHVSIFAARSEDYPGECYDTLSADM